MFLKNQASTGKRYFFEQFWNIYLKGIQLIAGQINNSGTSSQALYYQIKVTSRDGMSSCEPFLEWQNHQTVNLGSCLPAKIRQGDHEPSIHRHSRTVSTCILQGITELWKGQGFSPERSSPLKFSVPTAVILIGTKHSKRTTDKGYGYKITKKSASHKQLEKVFSITKLRRISLLNVYCCQNTNS